MFIPRYNQPNSRRLPFVFAIAHNKHPLQADLGAASNTKRPTSCLLVTPGSGFAAQDKYDSAVKEVKALAPTV